jgi:hypothetical protein
VSWFFFERPILKFKNRFKYAPARELPGQGGEDADRTAGPKGKVMARA